MNESILSATGLTKSYQLGKRSLEVLREVSLSVREGEFLAMRGASGAGKSTLLHLLAGLDTPNQGEVTCAGTQLNTLSDSDLAGFRNAKIGLVFQAYHLLPDLDALENVCLPARIAGTSPERSAARGRELLSRVGLADRLEHRPSELSGGEQQRVAIARALINQPVLILADEPTGNLDSHTGSGIIDLLCELQSERKTTLIIATHDGRVADRAPRVIELVDGSLAKS
jgi:predicted ABC-type transport system involved in lysophospholipase L1 biosynthesis ATPase subunit